MEVGMAALVGGRRRPSVLLQIALVVALGALLILGGAGCGDPDFAGTFRNEESGITVTIRKADDGTWLVRVGPALLVPAEAAVERDGKLYFGRGDALEFVPEGDDLRVNFGGVDEGAPSQLLRRVEQ
jgi:hypothetical protein